MRYKCYKCKLVLDESDVKDGTIIEKRGPWTYSKKTLLCPVCSGELQEMCPRDHCHCQHDIIETIAYCPDCGAAMCPECGCHDVAQISRVTGYLQEVSGWNIAKQQELKDRVRYNIP